MCFRYLESGSRVWGLSRRPRAIPCPRTHCKKGPTGLGWECLTHVAVYRRLMGVYTTLMVVCTTLMGVCTTLMGCVGPCRTRFNRQK